MNYKKFSIILILIFIFIAISAIFYFTNSEQEIENNLNENIVLEENKNIDNTKNTEPEKIIKRENEISPNTITIIEKNSDFSNTMNNCSISFKQNYPEIQSSNIKLAKYLNEKIQEIFKAQLFNNDNFSDCDGDSAEEINYNIITNNNEILSIEKSSYSYYAGAAHPNTFNSYHHFNLKTNEEIFFTDLLKKGIIETTEEMDTLYLLILKNLNITYPDFSNQWWIENPEEIINKESQFYILENELYIHFNPYDISAYALGHIEVTISINKLESYLNPEIISLWHK